MKGFFLIVIMDSVWFIIESVVLFGIVVFLEDYNIFLFFFIISLLIKFYFLILLNLEECRFIILKFLLMG